MQFIDNAIKSHTFTPLVPGVYVRDNAYLGWKCRQAAKGSENINTRRELNGKAAFLAIFRIQGGWFRLFVPMLRPMKSLTLST